MEESWILIFSGAKVCPSLWSPTGEEWVAVCKVVEADSAAVVVMVVEEADPSAVEAIEDEVEEAETLAAAAVVVTTEGQGVIDIYDRINDTRRKNPHF